MVEDLSQYFCFYFVLETKSRTPLPPQRWSVEVVNQVPLLLLLDHQLDLVHGAGLNHHINNVSVLRFLVTILKNENNFLFLEIIIFHLKNMVQSDVTKRSKFVGQTKKIELQN